MNKDTLPKKCLILVAAGILIGWSVSGLVEMLWGYPEPYIGAPFYQTTASIVPTPPDTWEQAFADGNGSRYRRWGTAIGDATETVSLQAGDRWVLTVYASPQDDYGAYTPFIVPTSTDSEQAIQTGTIEGYPFTYGPMTERTSVTSSGIDISWIAPTSTPTAPTGTVDTQQYDQWNLGGWSGLYLKCPDGSTHEFNSYTSADIVPYYQWGCYEIDPHNGKRVATN